MINSNLVNEDYLYKNKIWFNQRGGYIYKTIYDENTKQYKIEKLPWNNTNKKLMKQYRNANTQMGNNTIMK